MLVLLGARPAAAAPTDAQARAGRRIGILGPRAAPTTMQLEAELQLLGFEVVHAPAPAPERGSVDDLRALTRELDVAAVIFVDPRGTEIDLWVVDRVTGKTLIRSVVVGEVGTQDAERIAAVRAIDLLRASFRELEEHPAPPEAEVRPSLPVRRAMRPAAPRFAIGVGPSVAGAAGGLGATAHAAIALQFMPHRIFGIGLRAFVPVVGARVEAPEGVARVHIGWLTVGPRFAFVRADRRLQPSVGLSAGAVFVGMRGEARPPFAGRSDRVISAMLELDAALSIAVHSRIRIWLDASIGVAMPRVGVRIAGRREAAWGWPAGTGVAGIQLVF